MNKGFIKVYRKIQTHWLYSNNEYLACWIKILLNVNHSDNTVLLGGQLFNVKRGQSIRSLDQWSEIFGKSWDKSKTRRFFELLKKEHMIETINEQKTTRLNIVNFDTYNTQRNDDETINERKPTRSRNDDETILTPNKNVKNVKNDKEEKNNKPLPREWMSENLLKTLEDFKTMRKQIKKPLTDAGAELILNKLEKLSNKEPDTARAILEQSIENSWQGIFELKPINKIEEKPKAEDTVFIPKVPDPWEKYKTVKEVIDFFYTYVEQGQNIEAMIEFMKDKDPHLNSNEKENIKQVYKWGLKLINSGTYKINEKTKLNDMRWGLTV